MIALLISALLVSPLTPQKLWEREILCWPDTGYCGPRVVNLGSWDPTPAYKDWPNTPTLNAPKPWRVNETWEVPAY